MTTSTAPLSAPSASPARAISAISQSIVHSSGISWSSCSIPCNTPFLDQTYGRQQLIKYLAQNVDSGQVMALMVITTTD